MSFNCKIKKSSLSHLSYVLQVLKKMCKNVGCPKSEATGSILFAKQCYLSHLLLESKMPIAPHPTTGRGTMGKGTKKLGSGGSGGED